VKHLDAEVVGAAVGGGRRRVRGPRTALHLLRAEGLLEFRRGRGITVAGTPQRSAVLTRTRDLIEFARHHGFGREEIIQIIETLP